MIAGLFRPELCSGIRPVRFTSLTGRVAKTPHFTDPLTGSRLTGMGIPAPAHARTYSRPDQNGLNRSKTDLQCKPLIHDSTRRHFRLIHDPPALTYTQLPAP